MKLNTEIKLIIKPKIKVKLGLIIHKYPAIKLAGSAIIFKSLTFLLIFFFMLLIKRNMFVNLNILRSYLHPIGVSLCSPASLCFAVGYLLEIKILLDLFFLLQEYI